MELELEGLSNIEVSGDVEISLQPYMTMLPQEELDEARSAPNKSQLIIAAGMIPDSTKIIMFTGDNLFFTYDLVESDKIPKGKLIPIDFGQTLRIEDIHPSWGEIAYEIAADWILPRSSPLETFVIQSHC